MQKRSNNVPLLILTTLCGLAILGLVMGVAMFLESGFDVKETYKAADADAFHKSTTSKYMTLPREARVLSIQEKDFGVDGIAYKIVFQLPPTRTPDKWLHDIWTENHFALNSRKNDRLYSAFHEADSAERDDSSTPESSRREGWRSIAYFSADNAFHASISVFPGRPGERD